MKTKKKTILRVALGLLALFLLVNVCWFTWRAVKYSPYSRGMEENVFSNWVVPRYLYTDEEGYDFGVKYPGYLSLTGNLFVGLPGTDENTFTDCLFIWPKASGGYEYGVIVSENGESYQIYIQPDGSAVDSENSEIVARFRETIDTLLRRANARWDLS